jgi:hypothetical protein
MSIGFDTGTTTAPGATGQRWRSKSASALIRELLDSCGGDPLDKACRDQVTERFTYLLLNDEAARTEYLPSVAEYFAANALNALARNETRKLKRRPIGPQPDAGPEAEPSHEAPAAESAAPEASSSEATSPEAAAQVEAAIQRTAQQREARAKVREEIKQSLAIKYLDILMPNGKTLGDCSREDCLDLSIKTGAWYGRIAACLKPGEIVRAVLDNDALGRLYA